MLDNISVILTGVLTAILSALVGAWALMGAAPHFHEVFGSPPVQPGFGACFATAVLTFVASRLLFARD